MIEEKAIDFFSNLFMAGNTVNMEDVCSYAKRRLSDDQKLLLSNPFTMEEVELAIKHMGPLKALGSDGFPALFYQKFWRIVGKDVGNMILDVLNNNMDPSCLNHTLIALIPKVKCPEDFSQSWPISLCNVTMKIVTKSIANRLKLVLPDLISEQQSAFVPRRFITNNAIIAFEIFHYLTKKKKGIKGYFALKLHMTKAYDKMEWSFIKEVMENLNFPKSFSDLIMRCISTVSFSVLINGKQSLRFTPQRGLRQGDPLSPYIFILCAKIFSCLLERAEELNLIDGIKIVRNAPRLLICSLQMTVSYFPELTSIMLTLSLSLFKHMKEHQASRLI